MFVLSGYRRCTRHHYTYGQYRRVRQPPRATNIIFVRRGDGGSCGATLVVETNALFLAFSGFFLLRNLRWIFYSAQKANGRLNTYICIYFRNNATYGRDARNMITFPFFFFYSHRILTRDLDSDRDDGSLCARFRNADFYECPGSSGGILVFVRIPLLLGITHQVDGVFRCRRTTKTVKHRPKMATTAHISRRNHRERVSST